MRAAVKKDRLTLCMTPESRKSVGDLGEHCCPVDADAMPDEMKSGKWAGPYENDDDERVSGHDASDEESGHVATDEKTWLEATD